MFFFSPHSLQTPIATLQRHIVTKVNSTFLHEICSVNIPLNVRLNPDQKFPTLCEPKSCVNMFANTSWRIYQFHILSSRYAVVHKIWHLTSENSAQERMSYYECFTGSHIITFFCWLVLCRQQWCGFLKAYNLLFILHDCSGPWLIFRECFFPGICTRRWCQFKSCPEMLVSWDK